MCWLVAPFQICAVFQMSETGAGCKDSMAIDSRFAFDFVDHGRIRLIGAACMGWTITTQFLSSVLRNLKRF
jgi:hypothetical protein